MICCLGKQFHKYNGHILGKMTQLPNAYGFPNKVNLAVSESSDSLPILSLLRSFKTSDNRNELSELVAMWRSNPSKEIPQKSLSHIRRAPQHKVTLTKVDTVHILSVYELSPSYVRYRWRDSCIRTRDHKFLNNRIIRLLYHIRGSYGKELFVSMRSWRSLFWKKFLEKL